MYISKLVSKGICKRKREREKERELGSRQSKIRVNSPKNPVIYRANIA